MNMSEAHASPRQGHRVDNNSGTTAAAQGAPADSDFPSWFSDYLDSRYRAKKSPNTIAAITSDFTMIGRRITAGRPLAELSLAELTTEQMESAFTDYSKTHSANSCLRCRSTWTRLCQWLETRELLPGRNPMLTIEPVKRKASEPKSLKPETIEALVVAVGEVDSAPRSWPQMERAAILLSVLAGPREAELLALNIADIRDTPQGPVVQIRRAKGDKPRTVPIEGSMVEVIEDYLRSRESLFGAGRPRAAVEYPLRRFAPDDPLFVGSDGRRLTRGSLSYRIRRAYKRAGISPPDGALLHAFRHSFATQLADTGIDTFKLRALLGHSSLTSTQRYIDAAGQEHRGAAARNPLYRLTQR